MSDVRAEKQRIRSAALARRAELADGERRRASIHAADRLVPWLRPGEAVALFWPIRGEIDPLGLIGPVRAQGGMVLLPAVVDGEIRFRVYDEAHRMERGPLGTRHPPPAAPDRDPDLVVAPLSAFDRAGGRMGYGGGYYDRALGRLKAAGREVRFVGIAFACQEVTHVPMQDHDMPLDAVTTEDEVLDFTVSPDASR